MSYDTEYLMGLHLKGLFTKSKPKEFKFEAYGIPLYEMICFHNKLTLIKWKLDKRERHKNVTTQERLIVDREHVADIKIPEVIMSYMTQSKYDRMATE